jgi:hypothetical protein
VRVLICRELQYKMDQNGIFYIQSINAIWGSENKWKWCPNFYQILVQQMVWYQLYMYIHMCNIQGMYSKIRISCKHCICISLCMHSFFHLLIFSYIHVLTLIHLLIYSYVFICWFTHTCSLVHLCLRFIIYCLYNIYICASHDKRTPRGRQATQGMTVAQRGDRVPSDPRWQALETMVFPIKQRGVFLHKPFVETMKCFINRHNHLMII